ncbi:MAG: hypothetical protein SGARI_001553 [Bacillariaceae sp.]
MEACSFESKQVEGGTKWFLRMFSVADWIDKMKFNEDGIAENMTDILRSTPYASFRFEMPGVSFETAKNTPFEFVLVEDVDLFEFGESQNDGPFQEYLKCPPERPAATSFVNLTGDAILVAPYDWKSAGARVTNARSNYHGHIANFMAGATMEQAVGLWEFVATQFEEALAKDTTETLYLSTAGDGVAWVHFRIEDRPKYYQYGPYAP